MSDLDGFLIRHNIPRPTFDSSGLTWSGIQAVTDDYRKRQPDLQHVLRDVLERCTAMPRVHSVRARLKDPDHLAAKIIRKKVEKGKEISLDNYLTEVTDLVGVRVLHLFKADWESIHDEMKALWDTHEDPVAYYRDGDSPEYLEAFGSRGCIAKKHDLGYRSVHYVVKCAPTKRTSLVEVQVRTLFEEGWSEIDHLVRYPANGSPAALTPFLVLFNRVAGQADEMGTYVLLLKRVLEQQDERNAAAEAKVETLSKELAALVEGLGIEKEKNAAVQRKLAQLRDATRAPTAEPGVSGLGSGYYDLRGAQHLPSGPGVDALARSLATAASASIFHALGSSAARDFASFAAAARGPAAVPGLGAGDAATNAPNALAALNPTSSVAPGLGAVQAVNQAGDVARAGKPRK